MAGHDRTQPAARQAEDEDGDDEAWPLVYMYKLPDVFTRIIYSLSSNYFSDVFVPCAFPNHSTQDLWEEEQR